MINLIKAETKKIFFLRFSKIYLISVIGASLILGLIFSLTTNVTQGRALTELSPREVISANMLGVDLANIMLIVFTALSISKEFSTGQIYSSLAITPDRKRFFFGKLITYCLLSIIVSILITFLIYLTSQLILLANGMPGVSFQSTGIRQFVSGVSVMPVFYCLLTVGATFIFKSSGGGITFSLGMIALPALIKMFSDVVQKIFLPVLPQSAIHSLSGVVDKGSYDALGVSTSVCILLIWILITSLTAIIKFQKQDI